MLEFEQGSLSDQGPVRENNEDFLLFHSPDDPEMGQRRGCLFVIADGVGGNRAGEVASSQAAQALSKGYYAARANKTPGNALRDAFKEANLHVCDLSHSYEEYRKMETTLSALVLVGNQGWIGHIGDSRVYRVREQRIEQLTSDHSEVGELVRMGLITSVEARHHPRRNVITRSIGSDLIIKADFSVFDVQTGDIFVLCTDGLWEPVEDAEIARIVNTYLPSEACRKLIDLGLEREGTDNMSVQVIKVLEQNLVVENSSNQKNGLLQKLASRVFGS